MQGKQIRFAPLQLRESQTLRLQRLYKGSLVKPAVGTVADPDADDHRPDGLAAAPGPRLLDWCTALLEVLTVVAPARCAADDAR